MKTVSSNEKKDEVIMTNAELLDWTENYVKHRKLCSGSKLIMLRPAAAIVGCHAWYTA